jgi:hypothetical protein
MSTLSRIPSREYSRPGNDKATFLALVLLALCSVAPAVAQKDAATIYTTADSPFIRHSPVRFQRIGGGSDIREIYRWRASRMPFLIHLTGDEVELYDIFHRSGKTALHAIEGGTEWSVRREGDADNFYLIAPLNLPYSDPPKTYGGLVYSYRAIRVSDRKAEIYDCDLSAAKIRSPALREIYSVKVNEPVHVPIEERIAKMLASKPWDIVSDRCERMRRS